MRHILKQRALKLVFLANLISMIGSGMNGAAVSWYTLETTRSEIALGLLVVLQNLPALLLLPLTGVVIDTKDRRHLVMGLDAIRLLVIGVVAWFACRGHVPLWYLYVMNTLVSAAFWMFWPTVAALIQELAPASEFLHANTFLLAGLQGGWLIAGAIVGFVYNHIGLGGVLFIDCATYVASFTCYFLVRRGKHLVPHPEAAHAAPRGDGALRRYRREIQDGLAYVRAQPYVLLLGTSWALFIGGMLTQGVITAPLSEHVLHAGALGFGWLNGGWGVGAFLSALYAPIVIRRIGARRSVALTMALMAGGLLVLPWFPWLALGVALYCLLGSARGVGGVAISTSMMEIVPPHLMGRVQNTFYFAGTALQMMLGLVVGWVAERHSLHGAFAIVACLYLAAFATALWPVPRQVATAATSSGAAIEQQ